MNELQKIFEYNGNEIRTTIINEQPWFAACDISEALDFRDAYNACRALDEDERSTHTMSTPSGDQRITIINESGLFSLILKSRKPEAKKFKRWVTNDVLPSIRKTGSYGVIPKITQAELTLKIAEQQVGFEKELVDIKTRVVALEKVKQPIVQIPNIIIEPKISTCNTKSTKIKDDDYSTVNGFYSALGITLTGGQSRGVARTAKLKCKMKGFEIKSVPRSSGVASEVGSYPKCILRETFSEKGLY